MLALVLAVVLALMFVGGKLCGSRGEVVTIEADTVRVTDTVFVRMPEAVSVAVVRVDTVKVAVVRTVRDTLLVAVRDSVAVELPIVQRHYADTVYEAWVSGPLNPVLDSIRVFERVERVTVRERVKAGRWHVGLTAGVGIAGGGVAPYVGVGLTYSLWSL